MLIEILGLVGEGVFPVAIFDRILHKRQFVFESLGHILRESATDLGKGKTRIFLSHLGEDRGEGRGGEDDPNTSSSTSRHLATRVAIDTGCVAPER